MTMEYHMHIPSWSVTRNPISFNIHDQGKLGFQAILTPAQAEAMALDLLNAARWQRAEDGKL